MLTIKFRTPYRNFIRVSLILSINDRFLFRWQWYVCGVLFPGRQGRICCYADWVMLEANIMSHFVRTFQRLIQALQMGHRLPLSQGHFNNPHLQYSTCCLHRDNLGTQKPTRTAWGKGAMERQRPRRHSTSTFHPSWQMSLFRVHLYMRVGVVRLAFFQAPQRACLKSAAC